MTCICRRRESTFAVGVVIGVNRPTFGGTVPHFHQASREMRQMSRIFRKWYYFVCVADYSRFLPWKATKWRTSNKDRFKSRMPTDHWSVHTLGPIIYRSLRQTPTIFHARQPSPTTVYFLRRPPASRSINTATVVVFTYRLRKSNQRDFHLIWWVMVRG